MRDFKIFATAFVVCAIEPELIDGCLTFDAATDVPVDHWSWGNMKAVYR